MVGLLLAAYMLAVPSVQASSLADTSLAVADTSLASSDVSGVTDQPLVSDLPPVADVSGVSDQPPVAVVSRSSSATLTTEGSYLIVPSGATVVFSGTGSYDQDEGGSSISTYKWYEYVITSGLGRTSGYRAQGSAATTYVWTAPEVGSGEEARIRVSLRVWDDEGSYSPWKGVEIKVRGRAGREYYVRDHLGSVRAVVDETGSVVEGRDHYAFGLRVPGRGYVSGAEVREDFTGHERDGETGLVYAGARYYDAGLGRWTSVDPLAEEFPHVSPYVYVENDPLRMTDPTGMAPEDTLTFTKEGELVERRPGGKDVVRVIDIGLPPPGVTTYLGLPSEAAEIRTESARVPGVSSISAASDPTFAQNGPSGRVTDSVIKRSRASRFVGLLGTGTRRQEVSAPARSSRGNRGVLPETAQDLNAAGSGRTRTSQARGTTGRTINANGAKGAGGSYTPDFGSLTEVSPGSYVVTRQEGGVTTVGVVTENQATSDRVWDNWSLNDLIRNYYNSDNGAYHQAAVLIMSRLPHRR